MRSTNLIVFAAVILNSTVIQAADSLTWDGVSLTRVRHSTPERGAGGLLAREILAQAFLLAVRDELGLSTRDECLEEAGPSHSVRFTADIVFLNDKVLAEIARSRSQHEKLHSQALRPGWRRYLLLAAKAEELSRTDFPELLRQEGFRGTALKLSQLQIPDEVAKDLRELSLISQFTAVRTMHRLRSKEGDSLPLLGGLVRGYAHLGLLLAECHSPAHEVFAARSLLYAERMVKRTGGTADALHHRAYARALCGLSTAAEEDLAAAEKLGKSLLPAWATYIRPYCQLDWNELDRLSNADKVDFEIGSLLAVLAAQHVADNAQTFQLARRVQTSIPHCPRSGDVYSLFATIDEAKAATLVALNDFQADLEERIPILMDLPEVARMSIKPASRARLVRALQKAGVDDVGEPSWGALAGIINETTFLQCYRRWDLLSNKWSNEELTAQFLGEAQSLLAAHRWKNLLHRMSGVSTSEIPPPMDPDLRISPLFSYIPGVQGANALPIIANSDLTAPDLTLDVTLATQGPEDQGRMARELLQVCPGSLTARAALLVADPALREAEIVEWRKQFPKSPRLLQAVANFHLRKKQFDLALSAARQYVELVESADSYMLLADCHRQNSDIVRWREMLLKARPLARGLASSDILHRIANEYMDRGEFEAAKPFAEQAAESHAGWALLCAHRCFEGLRDSGKAEHYIRLIAERYDSSRFAWFFWCCRTGQGNRDAAEQVARRLQDGHPDTGFLQLLTGDYDSAQQTFDESFLVDFNPHLGLLSATVALDRDRPDEALRILRTIRQHSRKFQVEGRPRERVVQLAERLADAMEKETPVDVGAVKELFDDAEQPDEERMAYITGRFLEYFKVLPEAKAFYMTAADSGEILNRHRVLAAAALRKLTPEKK